MQGIAKTALRLTKARRVEAARFFCDSSAMECALISAMEATSMFRRSLIVYAVLLVLVTPGWVSAQLDVKDHPLVSRFPG